MSQPIDLIIAFTGGGLLAALLSWARTERSENRRRTHELAQLRLERVYGPLYFLTERNINLIAHVQKIHDTTQTELSGKPWAKDEGTQSRVTESIMQTINIANGYVSEIRKNNSEICKVLGHHYSYIFQDDSELFQRFVLDNTRLEMEHPEGSGPAMPFEVAKKLGLMRFIHPEINDLVRSRVSKLQSLVSS